MDPFSLVVILGVLALGGIAAADPKVKADIIQKITTGGYSPPGSGKATQALEWNPLALKGFKVLSRKPADPRVDIVPSPAGPKPNPSPAYRPKVPNEDMGSIPQPVNRRDFHPPAPGDRKANAGFFLGPARGRGASSPS